jgi:hypothetical protein
MLMSDERWLEVRTGGTLPGVAKGTRRETEERPREMAARGEKVDASARLSAILRRSTTAARWACPSLPPLLLLLLLLLEDLGWRAVSDAHAAVALVDAMATEGSPSHNTRNAVAKSIPYKAAVSSDTPISLSSTMEPHMAGSSCKLRWK